MCHVDLVQPRCLQSQLQGVGNILGFHRGAELPGNDVAREVVEGQCDDPGADVIGDAVPHPIRPRAVIVQRLWPSSLIKIAPSIKRGSWDSDLLQRPPNRQMGLLEELDDLQLLCGRISHSSSSPSPVTLFLRTRFSRVRSATTSLSAMASRRRSLTSSEVAARAVSPATLLSSLKEVLRPAIVQVLRDPLAATQLGNTVLAAQAFQNDPDLSPRPNSACT